MNTYDRILSGELSSGDAANLVEEMLDELVNVAFHLDAHAGDGPALTRRDALILLQRLSPLIRKVKGV